MCLTAPARLLSIDDAADGSAGLVDIDGLRRRTSLVLVPDARPGDWLLVGAGNALRRLDPVEARELTDLIAAATAATAAPYPTGGRS
jgi:hydrogenase expression/formation protein HypC